MSWFLNGRSVEIISISCLISLKRGELSAGSSSVTVFMKSLKDFSEFWMHSAMKSSVN